MANVADVDTQDSDAVEEVERRFRSRGILHVIDDYSATRDVFTRALPTLTRILLLELLGALDFRWPWWFRPPSDSSPARAGSRG